MKIKKFRIRNFRSIIDTGEVSLDKKITLLLGKNEQGKTNILKGLESFDREYRYSEEDLSYLVDIDKSPHEIPIVTLWFELEEEDRKILASIDENFKDLDELVITKYFDGHYEVEKPNLKEFIEDIKPIVESILNILRENQETINRAVKLLDRIDKQKHINWIKSLQRPDGGFSHAPGQPSNLANTYFAVKTLIELEALNQIDKNKIIQFILSTEHPNGGFASTSGQQPDIVNTSYAIRLLKELNALDKIDKQKHINWIKSLQRPDGGFSNTPGQTSHMSYTYLAVEALRHLNALDQIDKGKITQFILSTEHINGGFGPLPNQQPQLAHTCQAILLLRILDKLSQIDINKHIEWIKTMQNPDGGFWSGVGQRQSDINQTYFAVKVLMESDALNQIDIERLIRFILALQHVNGGFIQTSGSQPYPQSTYYAIRLLKDIQNELIKRLNRYMRELERVPDPTRLNELVDAILNILKLFPEDLSELTNSIIIEKEKLKSYSNNNILKKILKLIPSFVYFDTVDIIGDSISLDEYLRNKDKYKTFTNLFKLASLDVEKVKELSNPHMRKRLFRKASARVTGMINEFWEQEEVRVNLDIDGDQILVFVEDDAGAQADPPSRRSDGFRWFLSFYINFMAGTKGELRNAVLLLDNPGWVLHPSGQKNLLKTLEEIAETNQIIIATHSPFLIDKNKLERIRIVERKPNLGTKVYEKFWDSMYDSLQTIRAAIGAEVSDSLFGHKNNIIVEGYSDKIYLEIMAEFLKKKNKESIDLDKVVIIGAGGADKVLYLLKWFKAEKYNVLAILDADNGGRKAKSEIENKHKEIDVNKEVLVLNEISEEFKGKNLEIEDLFDKEFYNLAVNRAYREILEDKLGKPEIRLEDLPPNGLMTKRYGKFFKEKRLGGFDKVMVALEIKKILSEDVSEDIENMLKKTIENFEKLFAKIKEKFSDRVEL